MLAWYRNANFTSPLTKAGEGGANGPRAISKNTERCSQPSVSQKRRKRNSIGNAIRPHSSGRFYMGMERKKVYARSIPPNFIVPCPPSLFQGEGDDLKASRDGIDIKSFSFPKVKRFFNGLLRTSLPQFRASDKKMLHFLVPRI